MSSKVLAANIIRRSLGLLECAQVHGSGYQVSSMKVERVTDEVMLEAITLRLDAKTSITIHISRKTEPGDCPPADFL